MTSGTILVVDDVPTNLNLLMDLLEARGYRVLVATDGESALEQAEYALPDMILLDVMMPGIDGFETCKRLKASEKTRDIPIIFMTALSDTVDKVHGFEIGAVDYVTKPLQHEEVIARVRTHLELRRQKQEVERLRQQEQQHYQRLSQMKDHILRTASHDLNNPLAAITMSVDLLHRYVAPEDRHIHDKLNQIDASVMYMRDLISNLLDLAKLQTGHGIERRETAVYELLDTNTAQMSVPAAAKGIALRVRRPAEDAILHCDPFQIGQVFQNLISNAIKYTDPGGAVTVGAELQPRQIDFCVADSGIGIPESDIPHLFEEFYRVNTGNHRKEAGTGLGLSIVREIVRQHGGSIRVESQLGAGSTFTFSLPRPARP
jgi:signal transduction histidine kinase